MNFLHAWSPMNCSKPAQPLILAIDMFLKFQEYIKSASPHTLRAYRLDLKQAFADEQAKEWTEESLWQAIRSAQMRWGSLSLASRNRKAATLMSFLDFLLIKGWIESSLTHQVFSPKVPKKIPHFISVDEVMSIIRSFTTSPSDDEKLLFLLLYGSGLRISEACAIKWSDLQMPQRVVRIKGKGGKERVSIILPSTVTLLQLREKNQKGKTDYLWGHQGLPTRRAYNWIRRRGALAGLLKPLNPHALRHSFATHLLSSGANLRTLQELLGHDSLAATEKYTHLDINHLARTLEGHHPLGRGRR